MANGEIYTQEEKAKVNALPPINQIGDMRKDVYDANNNSIVDKAGRIVYVAFNPSLSDIPIFKAVNVTGFDADDRAIVQLADNSLNQICQGVTLEIIPGGGAGFVIINGLLRDVDTSAWPPFTRLYLDTNGDLTDIPVDVPTVPILQQVGVTLTQNVNGLFFVERENGYEINSNVSEWATAKDYFVGDTVYCQLNQIIPSSFTQNFDQRLKIRCIEKHTSGVLDVDFQSNNYWLIISGNMRGDCYDPRSIEGDVFDMDNMLEGSLNLILTPAERAAIAALPSPVGDMIKSIYDPTAVNSDAFDMDNMAEGTTNKILTQAERDAIAQNTTDNSGPVTIHSDVTDAGSGQIITAQERTDINASIDVHSDVDLQTNAPAVGDLLIYDGSDFIPYVRERYFAQDNTTDTGIMAQTSKLLLQPNLTAGRTYEYFWRAEISNSSTSGSNITVFEVNGVEVDNIEIEPKDTDNWYQAGGFGEFTPGGSGVVDFEILFENIGGGSSGIRAARIVVKRVD